MIANFRYLHASLISFCIHATIFLLIYGIFSSTIPNKKLISKPLQVEIKFDLPNKNIAPSIPPSESIPASKIIDEPIYSRNNSSKTQQKINTLYESNLSELLSQEEEIEIIREEQEIAIFAQKIILTIENAWMKPKNIPLGLVANLRLKIRPSGRISSVDLVKSSGNIRFDNSALQAVRRVETFNFFGSIPKPLYEQEFKNISISFNPSI
jgi:colicin import membrane protein